MSDFRLETVDCEERKNTAFLACPCLPAGSSNDEAKVEEISIGLHMLSNDSQDLQPDLLPSAPFPEVLLQLSSRSKSVLPIDLVVNAHEWSSSLVFWDVELKKEAFVVVGGLRQVQATRPKTSPRTMERQSLRSCNATSVSLGQYAGAHQRHTKGLQRN